VSCRLFLALWPGPVSRAGAASVQASIAWPPGVRLAAPEGLHVTLHFIGAVPAERVPIVADALALKGGRTELQFDRLEIWKGGVVVLEPRAVPDSLAALHGRLAGALRAHGLPVDARPFRPHVTLARKAQGIALSPVAPVRWRSEGFALVLSAGGQYTVLRRY
jgi:2'-5' RNA ligase